MTKYDIIKEIKDIANSHDAKVNALQTELVYNAVLEFIRKRTLTESKLSLTDLGVFAVKTRAPRNGVNPKTQEKIVIPERKTITFKPGSTFYEELLGEKKEEQKSEEK